MRTPSFASSSLLVLGLAASAFGALALVPGDARACGGCFHGEPPPPRPGDPPEQPSVVTDHRMVLALSATSTTLWDQVEYAGAPEEFAWVLPIRGAVVVSLGSDKFIDALDQLTAPEIDSPRPSACPSNYGGAGCGGGGAAGCGASAADGTEDYGVGYQEDSGIFVTDRSAVGPYETVQVHGDTEDAIVGWLRAHKYVVPAEIEPILRHYVDDGFDFVAVRLRPGKGVQAMQPIRVSFRGAYPTLPLRMVAAGVGESVGIKLFVIGDGRWTTSNFPAFSIDPALLTWDFNAQRSDYVTTRDRMAKSFFGRAFALESSLDLQSSLFPSIPPPPHDPLLDASPDSAPDSAPDSVSDSVSDSAPDSPPDTAPPPTYDAGPPPAVDPYATDVAIAFGAYGYPTRRVTRLRADLPSRFLDDDLQLEADLNQGVLARQLQVQRSVNEPPCVQPTSNQQRGCAVTSTSGEGGAVPLTVAGLVLALSAVVARRIRR